MLDHLALQVADVDAAFGTRIVAAAGVRAAMRPGCDGVFFRDLDGNDVEAVRRTFPA